MQANAVAFSHLPFCILQYLGWLLQEAESYERALMKQGMDVKESKTENKALRGQVGALEEALQASQNQTNQV